jgi:hypothetical protein
MFSRCFALARILTLIIPLLAVCSAIFLITPVVLAQESPDIEALAHSAETIPLELAAPFELSEQRVRNDTGINVLIDLAHQASFKMMWTCPRTLRSQGLRAVGSQACLDTVLPPDSQVRVRVPIAGRYPFAWREAPEFNVVLTLPGTHQAYLEEEQDAVEEFLRGGGGLVVMRRLGTPLLERYGCSAHETPTQRGVKRDPVQLDDSWEVLQSLENGDPTFIARREFESGRIVITNAESYNPSSEDEEVADAELTAFMEQIQWAAGGRAPVGGTLRLPNERGGGGPIYPELEERFGQIVVYYAKNQIDELIETVRVTLPDVRTKLFEWLPSVEPADPMYIVLSAGGGGGWAVNAYLPKETGIISTSTDGVISIFAHEQAHTMGGPPNVNGEMAGDIPGGNRGEAHAGWFQGKACIAFDAGGGKDVNGILATEERAGEMLDLARYHESEYHEQWGKGKDWSKLWWIYSKLDERYGTTWYPRWKWVQYTRWADEPNRRLSWDDVVEDMSMAVGEDLFPFFTEIGTTLSKDRYPQFTYGRNTYQLPIAPLDRSEVGPTSIEPIGDYRRPLTPREVN